MKFSTRLYIAVACSILGLSSVFYPMKSNQVPTNNLTTKVEMTTKDALKSMTEQDGTNQGALMYNAALRQGDSYLAEIYKQDEIEAGIY